MRALSLLLKTWLIIGVALSPNLLMAQKKTVPTKTLYLSVGQAYDEKVPQLPDKPNYQGDFRKVTGLSAAQELKTIRFVPHSEGTRTLQILDESGAIVYEYLLNVSKSSLNKVAREIRSLLSDVEGIDVKIINNRVVVDGQVLLPRDLNRIYSVVTQYGDSASSLVTLSPLAQKKIAEFIERDINNPEIHVRAVNEKIMLEGVANDEAEKQRAEIIAKTYIPDIVVEAAEAGGIIKKRKVDAVINMITVRPPPEPEPGKIIQLVVHYVELQKDYTSGSRFQFTPSISDQSKVEVATGGNSPGGVVSSLTATVSNLLPKLNWAKQHGHARILQSSSVIVQDGQEGNLRSTTRIPYQIVGPQGVPSTAFEESGIITTIKPKIIGAKSDSISLKIDFALKSLLGLTDKGPLVSNSAIQTYVVVRSGQSAAIGGLVSNSSGKDYNKLPKDGSADNPLISLYSSKSFRRNQSQFVVFVTPIIKSSASAGSERLKQKFRLNN